MTRIKEEVVIKAQVICDRCDRSVEGSERPSNWWGILTTQTAYEGALAIGDRGVRLDICHRCWPDVREVLGIEED